MPATVRKLAPGADPADVGARVLAGGEKGRQRRAAEDAERVAETERFVARAAADDAARGNSPWGRAGRIAEKYRGIIARRTVAKYLARLSAVPSSRANTPAESGNGATRE